MSTPTPEPTLLELLEAEADEADDDAATARRCHDVDGLEHFESRAARLRSAAQRLRDEMERTRCMRIHDDEHYKAAAVILERINGGGATT